MRLAIRSQKLDIGERARGYIERRLRFLLGRYGPQIVRATVTLAAMNGPRRGMHTHCRIVVRLRHSVQVIAEDSDSNRKVAVDRASERVGKAVSRELERRRGRQIESSEVKARWQA